MGKFEEKLKEIQDASSSSDRKTFNRQDFDELATALLNEKDYTTTIVKVKKGEYTEVQDNPVEDLRKGLIGSVLKAAGHDTAEQQKFIEEYQYPTLPFYPFISETIEQYCSTGKSLTLRTKPDLAATIRIENKESEIKETKVVSTGEKRKSQLGPFRKLKVKSVCPPHLRKPIEE